MKLDIKTYEDKVRACWLGKNIGGTLGAPFECWRGVKDLDFYTHDLSVGVLPNDDLDLQLIWLNAAEKYGKNVNADILGEYWLSYIVADWSEYGAGKNNLKAGLPAGISGWYNNHNKDSCGCFIRSEIWACLAPGRPEIAVRYAYEDAIVDHADEGLYGEIFCAALESAAFVENDLRKLINIGLSYIPENCDLAKGINTAIDCYEKGLDWKAARKKILQEVPGSFGLLAGYIGEKDPEIPEGPLGYDAPSNVALMILGALYGEGDFSKSICISAGCCEDADCTAGTLGAILGIMGGTKVIDEKWLAPIGDEIKTISIDLTKAPGINIPKTVSELTDRTINLMSVFMYGFFDVRNQTIQTSDNLFDHLPEVEARNHMLFCDFLKKTKRSIRKANSIIDVIVDYKDNISIETDKEKTITLHLENKLRQHQWLTINPMFPEEWDVAGARIKVFNLDQGHGGNAFSKLSISFTPHMLNAARYDIPLIISSSARAEKLYINLVFIAD